MNAPPNFDRVLWLSPAEYEVFVWVGEGLSARQIANLPGRKRAHRTIIEYLYRIREKLGLPDQRQVTCLAAKYNLIGPKRERNWGRAAPYRFVEQPANIIPVAKETGGEPVSAFSFQLSALPI